MEKLVYAIFTTKDQQNQVNGVMNEIKGISETKLYALSFRDIWMAVSDFAPSKFRITKEIAIDYARVIEELAQNFDLLPVRFGTLLKSDEALSKLMMDHYNSITANLAKVKNKNEFGLKIIWDYEKGCEKIQKTIDSEEFSESRYFTKKTANTAYLLEKVKKHRLEEAILKYIEYLIEEINNNILQINPECKFKKMLTQNIILDGVFLVLKKQTGEFTEAIEELRRKHNDLHFLLTGPWPPYSFVEILIDE